MNEIAGSKPGDEDEDEDDYQLPDSPPLANGTLVLTQDEQHQCRLATIDDVRGRQYSLPDLQRCVVYVRTRKPYAVNEGYLVPWEGYAERLLDGCTSDDLPTAPCLSAWRAEIWVEGLISMVFWALGYLEHEARCRPEAQLMIDWTDPRITFFASDGRQDATANVWNDFFYQPCAMAEARTVKRAASHGSGVPHAAQLWGP